MMNATLGIPLLKTGIPGFDNLALGGLPLHRPTLVCGTAGSGKTILATQFLAEGIRQAGENGVFVTLEESPADIRNEMGVFGWDIARWEAEGKWAFVDAAPTGLEEESAPIGDYDLGGLLTRIEAAVAKVGASRLVMDASSVLFSRFLDKFKIRMELLRVIQSTRNLGVTSILTSERISDDGDISRYGVEEFVASNIVILRNVYEGNLRRRSLEILKMRGTPHRRGEFPVVIRSQAGMEVLSISALPLDYSHSRVRLPFGNEGLDQLCHGGLPQGSVTFVSGPTGSGKTLLACEFAAGGAPRGESCLFLGFEESRDQLAGNAACCGVDLGALEQAGLLRIVCEYPEASGAEERLIAIREAVARYRPRRLVIDSLSALRRAFSPKAFHEFAVGLTSLTKQQGILLLITAEISNVVSATSVSEENLSALMDTIIMLRYVEIGGQIHRGLVVLKMRGSSHATEIRQFTISGEGLRIGPAFEQYQGVLTGIVQPVPDDREPRQAPGEGGRA